MWPRVKVKVLQPGIKLYSLVISIISPCLKQISLQVSRHSQVLQVHLIKWSFLPWMWNGLLQTNQMCQQTTFHLSAEVLDFSNCDTEWKSRSSKVVSQCSTQWSPSPYQFIKNQSVNVWQKANVKMFWWNHVSRVLSFQYSENGMEESQKA